MTTTLLLVALLAAPQSTVKTTRELREALSKAAPGSKILVAPGDYEGGLFVSGVRGAAGKPVVVAAADPKNPPVFKGGGNAIQLSEVEHIELRDLVLKESTANGLSIDDGGKLETPSHHVVLRNLKITDIGARGNQDGIKLSGVADFRVEGCTIERWGTGGGSAIDMVGCHRGVIEGGTFIHDGSGGTGVQMKGGCSGIVVRKSRFENAGSRAVNIGGSTGLQYFRPPLKQPLHAEARDITVEGNTFLGSDAPVAFVGVDGAVVRFNTIYAPKRWAIRILQETTETGFVPCRKGDFSSNIVVFKGGQWSEGGVNIGGGTEPATFTFSRNAWYCADAPAQSRPKLPSAEKDGVYGTDPHLRDAEKGDLRLKADSPLKGVGAEALK
jgi:hypothetical protein